MISCFNAYNYSYDDADKHDADLDDADKRDTYLMLTSAGELQTFR